MLLFTLLSVSRSVFSITLCGGLRGSCHLFFAFSSTDCRINYEKYCNIQSELTIVFRCIVVCFVVSSVLYTPSRKKHSKMYFVEWLSFKCTLGAVVYIVMHVLEYAGLRFQSTFHGCAVFVCAFRSRLFHMFCIPFLHEILLLYNIICVICKGK